MRSPKQRRGPIGSARIDVSLAIDQRADLRWVLIPGRIDEPNIVGCTRGARDHQGQQHGPAGDTAVFVLRSHPVPHRKVSRQRLLRSGYSTGRAPNSRATIYLFLITTTDLPSLLL